MQPFEIGVARRLDRQNQKLGSLVAVELEQSRLESRELIGT